MRALACVLVLVVGCSSGPGSCPGGTHALGDLCVSDDAGRDAAASDASTSDANRADAFDPCGRCVAALPYCDLASGACVACLETAQCPEPATPVCDPTTHTCVGCIDDGQCTDRAAAVCDTATHACGPCSVAGDCAHVPMTSVCSHGLCLGCASNDDCAAGEGCDFTDNQCRPFTAASADVCDPCVRDAECRPGQLCVAFSYADSPTGSTWGRASCAWRRDATEVGAPNGDCANVRPYGTAIEEISADGVDATVCNLRDTTCEALADLGTATCPAGDPDCGADGFGDGVCGVAGSDRRCTVRCASDADCPIGHACDTALARPICTL